MNRYEEAAVRIMRSIAGLHPSSAQERLATEIGAAVEAERARCAAWVRHWQGHPYQGVDALLAIESGCGIGTIWMLPPEPPKARGA
jgi:hypothetical protein